jgi:hypothetical protein
VACRASPDGPQQQDQQTEGQDDGRSLHGLLGGGLAGDRPQG